MEPGGIADIDVAAEWGELAVGVNETEKDGESGHLGPAGLFWEGVSVRERSIDGARVDW